MREPAATKRSRQGAAAHRLHSLKTAYSRAAAACSALVLWGSLAGAQVVGSAPEHDIEAAYLYNFVTYVDWPPSVLGGKTPIEIGVLGDERVASALLDMTHDREIRGRSVAVRQVQPDDPVAGLHMLFIASESAEAIAGLREAARDGSVLVVTEWDGALGDGSIINFLLAGNRVRFEVSLDAAQASGLSVSSRLLAVAQRVEVGAEPSEPEVNQ